MARLDPGTWAWRGAVAQAMLALVLAKAVIATIGFARWRNWLGPPSGGAAGATHANATSFALAQAVERASARLPFETKCLPRAIALHWLLRRRNLPSRLVIAALPSGARGAVETLHAWVEVGDRILIGAIDLPYQPIAAFGD